MSAATRLNEIKYQPWATPPKSGWRSTVGVWLVALANLPVHEPDDPDLDDPRNTSLFYLLPPI